MMLGIEEAVLNAQVKRKLEEGLVISIDPASGGSSMPGYAVSRARVFLEAGILRLPKSENIAHRLHMLQQALGLVSKKFCPDTGFDMLIIENIAPTFGGKGFEKGRATQGVTHLHWSVGAILATQKWPTIVTVTPRTWHSWIKKTMCEGETNGLTFESEYDKTDANDALTMLAVVHDRCLGKVPGRFTVELLRKKQKD